MTDATELDVDFDVVRTGFAALDHERRELICFIGAEVDAKAFQDFLVPFLCRLSVESLEAAVPEVVEGMNKDAVDA